MTLTELSADVYSRLNGSEALTAILGEGKVFDGNPYPPPEKGPYVVIGDTQMDEGRLLSDLERIVYVYLHLWSSYNGRKEIISMEQVIEAEFMQAENLYFFERFEAARDIEEGWQHGVLVFRAYVDRG